MSKTIPDSNDNCLTGCDRLHLSNLLNIRTLDIIVVLENIISNERSSYSFKTNTRDIAQDALNKIKGGMNICEHEPLYFFSNESGAEPVEVKCKHCGIPIKAVWSADE